MESWRDIRFSVVFFYRSKTAEDMNELKTKNKADKIIEKNGNDVFLLI